MKKILTIGTLFVVLIALMAIATGTALAQPPVGAGAGKALLYTYPPDPDAGIGTWWSCPKGATSTNYPTSSFVVLNTNADGRLVGMVSLKGAEANTSYDIYITQDPGYCPEVAPIKNAITTNKRGNGNFEVDIARVGSAENFWVSAVEANVPYSEADILRSIAVQLD